MNVLIVEDELVIAQRLERLLRQEGGTMWTRIERCATLDEAEIRVAKETVDVVFLDLNLNGLDGFDLLADSAAQAFHTVVVSAHTDRALEAFEIGVLDFIGKPFGAERVRKTIERLRGARPEHPATALPVRTAGRIHFIGIDTIAYVRAAGSYAELVLHDGTVYAHRKPLDKLLSVLPAGFIRIHRAYLIRLSDITALHAREGSRYAVTLASGEELPVGRTRVAEVRRLLGG